VAGQWFVQGAGGVVVEWGVDERRLAEMTSLFKRYCEWNERPVDLLITRYEHRWEIFPSLFVGLALSPIFFCEMWWDYFVGQVEGGSRK
jgi:hypothetical protein